MHIADPRVSKFRAGSSGSLLLQDAFQNATPPPWAFILNQKEAHRMMAPFLQPVCLADDRQGPQNVDVTTKSCPNEKTARGTVGLTFSFLTTQLSGL